MKAGRWDTVVESGGAWRRVIRRRGHDGPLLLAGPVTWEWFTLAAPTVPYKTITGTVSGDGTQATLQLTSTETATGDLPPGRYEHKLTITDPALSGRSILLRGYVTVRNTLGQA